jgi:hypothetical protein
MAIHARWIVHSILYVHSARFKTCCGIVHYYSGQLVLYVSGQPGASVKAALLKLCVFVLYCSGQLVLYVSGHPSEY